MNRPRVLIVDLHGKGGTSLYAWALAGSLADLNFDITLLSPVREPMPQVGSDFAVRTWLPRARSSSRIRSILRQLATATVIVLAALRSRCGVVVKMVNDVGFVDAAVVRILHLVRRRVVLVVHNVALPGREVPPGLGTGAFEAADNLVTLCRSEHDRLAAAVPGAEGRITVIPHGEFNFAACAPGTSRTRLRARVLSDADDLLLLFFGRLEPYKGLDDLLDSLAILNDRGVDVSTIIAGEAPSATEKRRLQGRIDTLGLADRISLRVGYVSPSDVADLFTAADLAVLPYRDATQSGVVMTAYAYGCPVIATHVGGLPEYVDPGRTGALVPAHRPAETADVIAELAEHPEQLSTLRANLRNDLPNRFRWPSIAHRFAELLDGHA